MKSIIFKQIYEGIDIDVVFIMMAIQKIVCYYINITISMAQS